jgi:UDP-N-acetylglucosamine 1-carboxyvinyltransferase
MDKLVIKGGNELRGTVEVSAAKNASLPIMAATILLDKPVCLNNLPGLSDINFFKQILESLGAKVDNNLIDCSSLNNLKADYNLVRKMRASILVLGPLLSRFKEAIVSLPGGCAIGTRPVDLHIEGLKTLGAKIEIKNGYLHASTDGLVGADIHLDFPSVGATENLIMAAVYAKGTTRIFNYAEEPEVIDLINFLRKAKVQINERANSLEVIGCKIGDLYLDEYQIIGDRIEAATLIIAGAITKSNIKVAGFNPSHIEAVLNHLEGMNLKMNIMDNAVEILKSENIKSLSFETTVHPGFPTDVQAQMMTFLAAQEISTTVKENIFENRFMHVAELNRLGFNIEIDHNTAHIFKAHKLQGAPVMCTDLRASAALVLGALICEGETEILRIYHLDRGYVELERKLSDLGADIKRIKE